MDIAELRAKLQLAKGRRTQPEPTSPQSSTQRPLLWPPLPGGNAGVQYVAEVVYAGGEFESGEDEKRREMRSPASSPEPWSSCSSSTDERTRHATETRGSGPSTPRSGSTAFSEANTIESSNAAHHSQTDSGVAALDASKRVALRAPIRVPTATTERLTPMPLPHYMRPTVASEVATPRRTRSLRVAQRQSSLHDPWGTLLTPVR